MDESDQPRLRLSEAAAGARARRDARMTAFDFDASPFTIAWEVTRACAYKCMHCRADAQVRRDPRELDTNEALALIESLARFQTRPILVLTGGDPLMRRDLFALARHADAQGLRVALTPTATALPTRMRLAQARESGVRRIAFSIDAADPALHDRFRGFRGSYARTLSGLRNAIAEGLPVQVNTTLCALNVDQLQPMAQMLEELQVVQWSVFFLVPVGRGKRLPMLTPQQHEEALQWLADLSSEVSFDVKATAAPQYRRILRQRARRSAGAGFQFADGLSRPHEGKGVGDGRGFMFISHVGEVMPSGFLPLSAGNVRSEDPVAIYRSSRLFSQLRNSGALRGKCGRCEFKEVCGGSRARAYALTGDYLAADPSCPYTPSPAGTPSRVRVCGVGQSCIALLLRGPLQAR